MSVAPAPTESATILLPHATASAGRARECVQRALLARGVARDLVDDSVLIVSEILSNALKHARPLAGGKVQLTWSAGPDSVVLEVTDGGGATRPRVGAAAVTAGAGRGLAVVRRLSRDWGVREAPSGTTVWAVVDLDRRRVTHGPGVSKRSGAPLNGPVAV